MSNREKRRQELEAERLRDELVAREAEDQAPPRKPRQRPDPVIERRLPARRRRQCEHLAALIWADGDAVGDRRTQQLGNRVGLEVIAPRAVVLRIALQQSLALQIPTDAQRQGLGQSGKQAQ